MDPLLHYKVHQFDDQMKIFERLSVASGELGDPERVFQEIDRVISAIQRYKRSGYLELPRDMVSAPSGCKSYIPAQAEELGTDHPTRRLYRKPSP
jgi:indolepyruvate decarboxylase